MEITTLTEDAIGDAARLAAGAYRAERQAVPELPSLYEDALVLEPLIRKRLDAPAVLAVKDGKPAGFLTTALAERLHGRRGAFVGEWGHAVDVSLPPEERYHIYREMYAEIFRDWVADDRFSHAVSMYAHDEAAVQAWFRSSFGMLCVDAVRCLEPVRDDVHCRAAEAPAAPVSGGFQIRRASSSDMDAVTALKELHSLYMAASPLFMPPERPDKLRERWEKWLDDESHHFYLAYCGGEAVAYIQWQPYYLEACHVVRDPGTAAINGAFTKEEHRRWGIATALLNRVLDDAREKGYTRCSVDFESHNILGSRFWLDHFKPVCYSLFRRVDERITEFSTLP